MFGNPDPNRWDVPWLDCCEPNMCEEPWEFDVVPKEPTEDGDVDPLPMKLLIKLPKELLPKFDDKLLPPKPGENLEFRFEL